MNRRYHALLAFLTSTAISMSAASGYRWMTFTLADNSQLTVAADNLHIDYSGSHLKLTSPTVNETLPASSIKSMRFTDTSSNAVEIPSVKAAESVTLYSPNGVKAGEFKNCDAARAALPSGVYIIRQESKTIKIIF